jgi:hypothetical protein
MKTLKEWGAVLAIGFILLAAIVWGGYSEYQKWQYRQAVIELAKHRK